MNVCTFKDLPTYNLFKIKHFNDGNIMLHKNEQTSLQCVCYSCTCHESYYLDPFGRDEIAGNYEWTEAT